MMRTARSAPCPAAICSHHRGCCSENLALPGLGDVAANTLPSPIVGTAHAQAVPRTAALSVPHEVPILLCRLGCCPARHGAPPGPRCDTAALWGHCALLVLPKVLSGSSCRKTAEEQDHSTPRSPPRCL